MAPLRSIAGRSLGKLLEGFKTSTLGQGFGGGDDGFEATGGSSISIIGNYKIHTFSYPNSSHFTVLSGTKEIDFILVAGGGGCGYDVGGGGGGGGIAYGVGYPVGPGTHPVVIGVGGDPSTTPGVLGTSGDPSVFTIDGTFITAKGGGGGGTYASPGQGVNGGSGGGGGAAGYGGGTATQPGTNPSPFVTDYGWAGGDAAGSPHGSGGGGGVGGVGADGSPGNNVLGGAALPFSVSGTEYYYSGGGYGNSDSGPIQATGLLYPGASRGADPNATGFGANGTGSGNNPYPGGPGILIIRYLVN